jgi:hypothetical protein
VPLNERSRMLWIYRYFTFLHLLVLSKGFSLVPVHTSKIVTSFSRLTNQRDLLLLSRLTARSNDDQDEDDDDDDDAWIAKDIDEVIRNDSYDLEDEEWLPDREKARQKLLQRELYQANRRTIRPEDSRVATVNEDPVADSQQEVRKVSPYTEEEEEVIRAMGGKNVNAPRLREPGYLGDSTLDEIARDYSVPVCYLADVLTMWGVPVPINVHDRLGDLVTGEQAFALLEAVNSLDVSALQDRYSNQSLLNLCNDQDIDITEAFAMAVKEDWSLPFGVRTVLRVEQEEELLRVLGGYGS